jgi:hypothetical protein
MPTSDREALGFFLGMACLLLILLLLAAFGGSQYR